MPETGGWGCISWFSLLMSKHPLVKEPFVHQPRQRKDACKKLAYISAMLMGFFPYGETDLIIKGNILLSHKIYKAVSNDIFAT